MDPFADIKTKFSFEDFVASQMPPLLIENMHANSGNISKDPKHRTVVCRHWLVGLCQKGSGCEYLHRLDKSRMPLCKHNKICKIRNCPLKHEEIEEKEECPYYRQGFCKNGPNCKFKHIKRSPDECPLVANFDSVMGGGGGGSGGGGGGGFGSMKKRATVPNELFKISICKHWLETGVCPFNDDCHYAHGDAEIKSIHATDEYEDSKIYDPTRGLMDAPLELPFQARDRIAFFTLQAPDVRSLIVSKRRGVWKTTQKSVFELNKAVQGNEKVLIFFVIQHLKAIYGVASLSNVVKLVPGPPSAPVEFEITWLRCIRVGLRLLTPLKTASYGGAGGRSTSDARLDRSVGQEMMLMSYRKPVWEWSNDADKVSPLALPMNAALPEDVLYHDDWFNRPPENVAPAAPPRRGVEPPPRAPPANVSNDFYTGEIPGFIFTTNTNLLEEIFHLLLFALPPQLMDLAARNIKPTAPLFLLDVQSQLLYGLFQAVTPVGENLEPGAFHRFPVQNPTASPFPVQVRCSLVLECLPVHESDKDLRSIFHSKPLGVGPLPLRETKQLANLFASRVGLFPQMPPNMASSRKIPPNMPVPMSMPMPMHAPPMGPMSHDLGPGFYKPPFRYVDVVYINLQANMVEIKKRVLGNNAAKVLQIISELGNQRNIKIRIRGKGSGFFEGAHQQELPEPLHFNVSADSEELLRRVVERVRGLVERARMDIMAGRPPE